MDVSERVVGSPGGGLGVIGDLKLIHDDGRFLRAVPLPWRWTGIVPSHSVSLFFRDSCRVDAQKLSVLCDPSRRFGGLLPSTLDQIFRCVEAEETLLYFVGYDSH